MCAPVFSRLAIVFPIIKNDETSIAIGRVLRRARIRGRLQMMSVLVFFWFSTVLVFRGRRAEADTC